MDTGAVVCLLDGHLRRVSAIPLHEAAPGELWIATACADHDARLWKVTATAVQCAIVSTAGTRRHRMSYMWGTRFTPRVFCTLPVE